MYAAFLIVTQIGASCTWFVETWRSSIYITYLMTTFVNSLNCSFVRLKFALLNCDSYLEMDIIMVFQVVASLVVPGTAFNRFKIFPGKLIGIIICTYAAIISRFLSVITFAVLQDVGTQL